MAYRRLPWIIATVVSATAVAIALFKQDPTAILAAMSVGIVMAVARSAMES